MKYKNIYVAATSQHVGKTTSTLGLVSCMMHRGINVGYCKPVGQRFLDIADLRVDKDTILFADLINFKIEPEIHSPIILGKGQTEKILDNPDLLNLDQMLLNAATALSRKHELTIYEGTGHPGVGSVANVSNARVAKMLNAGVIMIVEGGIGNTIDMLNQSLALFREEAVPIIGVIINKVHQDKLEKVRYYVNKWMEPRGLKILGLMPYDPTMAYPLIRTIAEAVNGTIIYNNAYAFNKVESIIAGSLIDLKELTSSQDLLLVVSTKSLNEAITKIKWLSELNNFEHCPLSGIVTTGSGNIDQSTLHYIEENNIPLIRTDLDTYGVAVKISKIEVKINQNTPWKVTRAINLIESNVDLDYILDFCKNEPPL
jgi:hypothetical protein